MTRSRLRRIPFGSIALLVARGPRRRGLRRARRSGWLRWPERVRDTAPTPDAGAAGRGSGQPPGLAVHADLPGDAHHPDRRLHVPRDVGVPAAIGWSIVVLTLIVRALVIPLVRKQLVSQRRMQLLQPEIKEIQKRYKGDAMKARTAQQELFKERGINPLAGCFPLLLQMPLLFIMYSVIQNGLTNGDPTRHALGLRPPDRPARVHQRRTASPTGARRASTRSSRCLGGVNVGKPSTIFAVARLRASASWPSSRPCSSSCSRG